MENFIRLRKNVERKLFSLEPHVFKLFTVTEIILSVLKKVRIHSLAIELLKYNTIFNFKTYSNNLLSTQKSCETLLAIQIDATAHEQRGPKRNLQLGLYGMLTKKNQKMRLQRNLVIRAQSFFSVHSWNAHLHH